MKSTDIHIFNVSNVEQCDKIYDLETIGETEMTKIINHDNKSKTKWCFECGNSNYPIISDINRNQNAFVGTIYKAYCDKCPLELSVNDFWLIIMQGISQHINDDPTKYNSIFSNDIEQKNIRIRC